LPAGASAQAGGTRKPFAPSSGQTNSDTNSVALSDSQGAQVLKTSYTYDADIEPNSFVVQAGKPVKLEIDVKENGYGCMSTIVVPGLYEKPEYLQAGKIIVMNFTPQKTGDYPITCAMGVPRGIIKVQ